MGLCDLSESLSEDVAVKLFSGISNFMQDKLLLTE